MYGRHRPGPFLAVLTALAFGCATVRVPVGELGQPAPLSRGAVAEPAVELWLESGESVSPAEAEQAFLEARTALGSALSGKSTGAEESDYVLYVRERAVVRTASRRTSQSLAVAGIAVAAVAVVVVAVLAIAGGKGGGSGPRIRGPSAVPAPPRLAPRVAPAPPRVAPAMRPPPRGGGAHTPVVDGWIEAVGQAPGPEAPAGDAWAVAPGADPWDVPPGAEPWAGPGRPDDVPEPALPPAAELDVARRGFFARDAFVVDLVLVERRTGRAVWAKAIRRDADARNPRAVAECIEEGLAELGWAAPSAP